jgi:zinc/manganese transport system permease protein
VYAGILALWLRYGERMGGVGFYLLFACAVTISVQLVGLYLVFTTLIVPALATRGLARRRLALGYGLGALGYAAGLALSLASDFPPGPLIVCLMSGLGMLLFIVNAAAKSTP